MSNRLNFSILTPCLDPGAWLPLCQASALDQQIPVEHVIQDGGSTDGTLERLAAEGVAFETAPDSGMYQALNRALSRSSGEIIGHLNADEQYLPGTLERVRQIFDVRPTVDVVCGDILVFDHRFRPRSYRRSVLPPAGAAGLAPLQIPTGAMFLRRRSFDSGLRYREDLRAIADAIFVEDLIANDRVWHLDPRPYTAFFLHADNLSRAPGAIADAGKLSGGATSRPFTREILRARVWLRKFLAGAYKNRPVSTSLFTPDSPNRRIRIESPKVTWRWPTDYA